MAINLDPKETFAFPEADQRVLGSLFLQVPPCPPPFTPYKMRTYLFAFRSGWAMWQLGQVLQRTAEGMQTKKAEPLQGSGLLNGRGLDAVPPREFQLGWGEVEEILIRPHLHIKEPFLLG